MDSFWNYPVSSSFCRWLCLLINLSLTFFLFTKKVLSFFRNAKLYLRFISLTPLTQHRAPVKRAWWWWSMVYSVPYKNVQEAYASLQVRSLVALWRQSEFRFMCSPSMVVASVGLGLIVKEDGEKIWVEALWKHRPPCSS